MTRLVAALSKTDLFANNPLPGGKTELDADLGKLLKAFEKAAGGLSRGGALSDFEDSGDDEWDDVQMRARDPLDYFDDSDFEEGDYTE